MHKKISNLFARPIPLFGHVFDTCLGSRDGSDGKAADIFLRPVVSPDDASRALTLEEVTCCLKKHIEAEKLYRPFGDRVQERMIREVEDAWSKNLPVIACKTDGDSRYVALRAIFASQLAAQRINNENLPPEEKKKKLFKMMGEVLREIETKTPGLLEREAAKEKRILKRKKASYPTLFRAFGALQPTPKVILEFANNYGNLRGVCNLLVFHEEVLAMRRAIRVWELVKKCDDKDTKSDIRKDATNELRRHFQLRCIWDLEPILAQCEPLREYDRQNFRSPFELRWYDVRLLDPSNENRMGAYHELNLVFDSHPELGQNKQPAFPDRRATEVIPWEEVSRPTSAERIEEICTELKNGKNASRLARVYLRKVIQSHIEKNACSVLDWDEDRMVRHLVPSNLLGALWIQFEEAVAGTKKYRRCSVCGGEFEISREAFRATKDTCSDPCRNKKSRQRKKDQGKC